MKIKTNIDLFNEMNKYEYTLLGVNISGSMRNGLAHQIALNYPHVHEMNLKTPYGDLNKLGTILECSSEGEPSVILLFMTRGYPSKKIKGEKVDYVNYEALEKCLRLINIKYKGKKIASPIIGASRFDGDGDKDKIIELFKENLPDINLTLYDYEQLSRDEQIRRVREYELEIKKTSQRRYNFLVRKRKEREKEIKNKNGRAKS